MRLRSLLVMALISLAAGCEGGRAVRPDPGVQWTTVAAVRAPRPLTVDLLFVVDTSASMAEEQEVLLEQMVAMARELIAPADESDPRVNDLHVGVVTADMDAPGQGGVLQNVGRLQGCLERYSANDCDREECPWLSHSYVHHDDGTDPDDAPLWEDLRCIASLGAGGSAMEEPFEAARAALYEQAGPGMPNEGFLRKDALLAIIFMTDEDDCSGGSVTDADEPGVECILDEEELGSVAMYHDAFVALRDDDENLVVLSAIAGVPIDGSWNPGDPISELRDLRRVVGGVPASSCQTDHGSAYYPVRIAELVYTFGNNGVLESACRDDWTPALQAITRCIGGGCIPWVWFLSGVCLDQEVDDGASTSCRVVMTMLSGVPCPGVAEDAGPARAAGWTIPLGTDEEGREQCEVLPADYDEDSYPDSSSTVQPDGSESPVELQGWLIDRSRDECEHGELRFTAEEVTSYYSEIRLECPAAP